MSQFLPTTLEQAKQLGFEQLDVIIVSADAYVDHPAFAASIIGRYLESLGLKVGIIPQPDWHDTKDFTVLGRPRLFFGVTAGNIDSMVSLYTAQRKIRSDDPYGENGIAGKRPYLPSIVYTNRIKQAYKSVPVIVGGIEASLRRVAHYDFYTDKVRPSILLDAKADLLVYGNGEAPLKEIVRRLKKGTPIADIKEVRGTVVPLKQSEKVSVDEICPLPSFEKVRDDKNSFCEMTRILINNLNPYNAQPLYQQTGVRSILINPPSFPLSPQELDAIYELPFTRKAHPRHKGKIPALEVVETSITSHRGCYGGCSFCALYLHQGKFVQSRSKSSIIREAHLLAKEKTKNFVISDVSGPTANMYSTFCIDINAQKTCRRISCIFPEICKNLNFSTKDYLELLSNLRNDPAIKHVFVNSGIRHDLALLEPRFIEEMARYYTCGQLSTAPEHCEPDVMKIMCKPQIELYDKFSKIFYENCKKCGKEQYLIPYFIVGHPGADENIENKLRKYLSDRKIRVEQVQEFYPTPMSVSTAMYHTGMNVFTGERINVEKKLGVKKRWKQALFKL